MGRSFLISIGNMGTFDAIPDDLFAFAPLFKSGNALGNVPEIILAIRLPDPHHRINVEGDYITAFYISQVVIEGP